MNLAFSTLGCPEIARADLAELAARYGFGGIELRGVAGEHVDPGMSASDRTALKRSLDDAGVKAISVTAYTKFGTSDAGTLTRMVDELVDVARLAADLEAPYVRTFVGGGEHLGDAAGHYGAAAEALLAAAERCEPLGVTILVETHDTVCSTAETMRLLDLARHDRIGVLWDVAHTLRTGESVEEGWSAVRDRIGYLHLKDERPRVGGGIDVTLPGDGVVPLTRIRDLLGADGFRGWFCLEWERKWHPELPPIADALDAYRSLMTS